MKDLRLIYLVRSYHEVCKRDDVPYLDTIDIAHVFVAD